MRKNFYMKEIIENYNMGLITDNEFKFQFLDSVPKEKLNNFIQSLIIEIKVSDFEKIAKRFI